MHETEIETEILHTEPLHQHNPIARFVRTVTFASIGAIAITREKSEHVLHQLAERGEAEVQHTRQAMRQTKTKVGRPGKKHLRKLYPRRKRAANLPTSSELDALREQLAKLSQELDELHSDVVTLPQGTTE